MFTRTDAHKTPFISNGHESRVVAPSLDARFGHALDVHIHRESDVAVTQNRLNRFPLMLRRFCRYPISQGAIVMYTFGLEIGRGSGW